jgi:peptidoglycan-associated lipoprotein
MVTAAAVILIATGLAGCGRKAPPALPPAPVEAGTAYEQPSDESSLDALRRDFVAQAGSDSVYFDLDSSVLDDRDRATLDAQARWLAAHPGVTVTVEGHCDERGTREYNLALGDRRAAAAKNHLESRGIAPSRMRVLSWGKERPAALGSDEASWAQNRRAVTILVSRG